ncbi:hypothetical protein GCM10023065_29580 [Microbacterium laevaniformans]|uniref:hypothetical protein n=1 Tax=Microbacterium laevaniformans TaxID=36807 RepID=UPI00195EDEB3|nr:hypothetical protein [Microbacterium laevaniformans]MBM7753922.1 hypothetical protein [Microbacterium laevaniformans]GLJ63152.1 hypothetical protein GCM10017578_00390 [Microbacterium laevaniformans]
MTAPRLVSRAAFALLVAAGALAFAGCAAGSGTAASPSVSASGAIGGGTSAPSDGASDPGDGDGDGGGDAGGGAAPAAPSMALADVLARYPDCAAMGSVLGSAIDGLELGEQSNEDGTVQCNWMSTTGDYVNTVLLTVTTNNGAGDVPKKEDIAAIGSEYIADAAVEARGGIAYGTKSTGDLRIYGTLVDMPGVGVSISSGALNEDPRLFGAPAVAAAKQLLGIAG